MGPSGCGKTTTLRLIAGFETPDTGKIIFEGKDISHIAPYKRNVNTVFQKYALFPNMNVFENIAFGLRIKKMNEKLIREKVTEVLKLVNLSGFEKRKINNLRSEEHTSELQSLMRNSYAVFCLKKKNKLISTLGLQALK